MRFLRKLLVPLAVGLVVAGFGWWRAPYVHLSISVPGLTRAHSAATRFNDVSSGVFSPDGKLLAIPSPEGVRVCDAPTGATLFETRNHPSTMGFTPHNKTFVVYNASAGTVSIWHVPTGHQTETYEARACEGIVPTPSGEFLLVAREKDTFSVFDLFTKAKVAAFETQRDTAIWWWIPKNLIATSTFPGGKEILWDVSSGKSVGVLEAGARNGLTSYVFAPGSNTLLRLDMDDSTWKLRVLNAETGKWRFLTAAISGCPVISPNRKYGAVWQDDVAEFADSWFYRGLNNLGLSGEQRYSVFVVYELATGSEVGTLRDDCSPSIHPPSFSPDGTILAVAYENEVRVYDFPLHKPWGRIAAYALLGASLTFGLGQFVAWRRWRRKRL